MIGFNFKIQILNIFLERPTAPKNVHISKLTEQSLTVTWDQDLQRGVDWYYVDCRAEGDKEFTAIGRADGHDNSFTCDFLKKGINYYFRVSAKNHYGLSSDSTETLKPVSLQAIKC